MQGPKSQNGASLRGTLEAKSPLPVILKKGRDTMPSAFATLKLPVDLTRCHNAASIARSIVEDYPGTRHVALDETASVVSFDLLFPGNVSGLVRRLASNLIPVGDAVSVSLPLRILAPERMGDAAAVGEHVVEGAEIWDVAFPRGEWVLAAELVGDRLEASIVPDSHGMHQIYDSLLTVGVVAKSTTAAAIERGQ